jgi:hypothetical protein
LLQFLLPRRGHFADFRGLGDQSSTSQRVESLMNLCCKIEENEIQVAEFGNEKHRVISISSFLKTPDAAIELACLQKFTSITPQYPGVRAPLADATLKNWCETLTPLLNAQFGNAYTQWVVHGWHSIVTRPPEKLQPIQCLPHVDGVDPGQIAMMLYLHHTPHGGTGFFRHKATGFESLTAGSFPVYKKSLEGEAAARGLPPRGYVTNGEPFFERIHEEAGDFNRAIFYRGNIFHSGVIDPESALPSDPRHGRYTINAFLRPKTGG